MQQNSVGAGQSPGVGAVQHRQVTEVEARSRLRSLVSTDVRQMDYARNEQGRTVRRNMTSAEDDLMALALRTKPHTISWLCLSPRVCILGEDEPAVIKEINTYLRNLFNERELAGGIMLQLM